MRLGRCPVCHAHLHLDALVQDEAGRDIRRVELRLNESLLGALRKIREGGFTDCNLVGLCAVVPPAACT